MGPQLLVSVEPRGEALDSVEIDDRERVGRLRRPRSGTGDGARRRATGLVDLHYYRAFAPAQADDNRVSARPLEAKIASRSSPEQFWTMSYALKAIVALHSSWDFCGF
jgi:hypothetical protein